jgi:hypothetical protein
VGGRGSEASNGNGDLPCSPALGCSCFHSVVVTAVASAGRGVSVVGLAGGDEARRAPCPVAWGAGSVWWRCGDGGALVVDSSHCRAQLSLRVPFWPFGITPRAPVSVGFFSFFSGSGDAVVGIAAMCGNGAGPTCQWSRGSFIEVRYADGSLVFTAQPISSGACR